MWLVQEQIARHQSLLSEIVRTETLLSMGARDRGYHTNSICKVDGSVTPCLWKRLWKSQSLLCLFAKWQLEAKYCMWPTNGASAFRSKAGLTVNPDIVIFRMAHYRLPNYVFLQFTYYGSERLDSSVRVYACYPFLNIGVTFACFHRGAAADFRDFWNIIYSIGYISFDALLRKRAWMLSGPLAV